MAEPNGAQRSVCDALALKAPADSGPAVETALPSRTNRPDAHPRGDSEETASSDADRPDAGANDEDARKTDQPPAKPWYRRPLLVACLVVVGLALLVGLVVYWLYSRQFENTDDAFIDGNAPQIASKVSGYVAKLLVADNQFVRQGDVLLEIDARDYQLALAQAKAAVATAQGKREEAQAQLATAKAQSLAAAADVAAARATADNARIDLERNRKLAPKGAVSQQSLDAASEHARSSSAQENAATSRAAAADAQAQYAASQLVTAEAELKEAQVRVETAELNRSYTRIVAPTSGRVTHRTVNLGDYLTPGQALFALVEPNVWVTANFKENQLSHMQAGQPVEINIDAYPGRTLRGRVDSFQRGAGARFSLLPAENATGNYVKIVQRLPVKIVFDSPPPEDMILGPGMSVEPTVTVRPWRRAAANEAP